MSSNFRQIRLLTTELAALERLKHQCLHFFSVGIDPILFKVGGYIDMDNILHEFEFFVLILFILTGKEDIHKISDKFEFWPDRTTDYRVSCPWASKKFPIEMGKWSLHASAFIFDWIIIKVAGNQDRHKSSDEFDFGPDQTTHFGVTFPWMTKFYTYELKYLWGQSASLDQILCVASLGVGKGCIMFWGRLDQNSGVHGNRKPPLTYNGEIGVSTFSGLLLIRSFIYLQVTRTCIKSWTSSNFGQIGPLTTELSALECLKNFPDL